MLKKPHSTENFLFKNDSPLQVNVAIDADGTGPKTKISDSFARNAEAIIALDDTHFLATFSNHYQFFDKNTNSVVGPGIVALLAVENGQLVTKKIEVLKFKNPMYFLPKDNFIWLTCPGAWRVEDNLYKSSEAGIVKLKLDADKNGYPAYLDWAYNNLKKGGVVLGDNTLAWGLIARTDIVDERERKQVANLKKFNEMCARDGRFRATMLPTGEGLTMAVKK